MTPSVAAPGDTNPSDATDLMAQRSTLGDRASAVAASQPWNNLPVQSNCSLSDRLPSTECRHSCADRSSKIADAGPLRYLYCR